MSALTLYADLSLRKLIAKDGGAVSLPGFVLGDLASFTLHTLDSSGDSLVEKNLRVRTLHASMGGVLTPPAGGSFSLRSHTVGGVQTDLTNVSCAATAGDFLTAAEPLGWASSMLAPDVATWLLKTTFASDGPAPPDLVVVANTLTPTAFVRIRRFPSSGFHWFEIRLIQAPLAWNEDGHERVLPPPPVVSRVRDGVAGSGTEPPQNELQKLLLPRDFRGTYFLRWNFRASRILGIEDGPDEIAAALNAMFAGGGKRFAATNPEEDYAYLEFIGEFAATPQPLITAEVSSFQPGVLTFALPLDRADLAAALRAEPEITVPFECELEVVDDDGDPAVPGRLFTLFQQPVKIVREQIWKELTAVPAIDWLRPPSPRSYIPFTADQVITGVQHYTAVFGDGAVTEFSFAHNLGTEAGHLAIRENVSGGRLLAPTEYEIEFSSANELVARFAAAPPLHALALTFSTAGPRSAFQDHTHTIAQIVGLQAALDWFAASLAALQGLFPSGILIPAAPGSDAEMLLTVPDFAPPPLPPYETIPLPGVPGFLLFAPLPIAFASTTLGADLTGALPAAGTTAERRRVVGGAASLERAFADGDIIAWNGSAWERIVPAPVISTFVADPTAESLTTATAHGLAVGDRVSLSTSYLLPAPLNSATTYFVVAVLSATGIRVSTVNGGAAENLTDAGGGTHTIQRAAWYPAHFEETLFTIACDEQQLAAASQLVVTFSPRFQLLTPDVPAQRTTGVVKLVIEHAQRVTAAGGHYNVADLAFTTAAEVPITLGASLESVPLEVIISRAAGGALSASCRRYLQVAATVPAPASANFILRARLTQFDCENRTDPRGSFIRECREVLARFTSL